MDKQEFARRVTQMQSSLYRVAASYLRCESDRLDAVSEAIARAWEKRGTLREKAWFATWITRILIRVCVDAVMLGKEGAVVSWTHDGKPLPDVTESTWGRAAVYDAKSLTDLAQLLDDLDELYVRYPENLWTRTPESDAAIDVRLIEAGFSAKQYNHAQPTEEMLTEEEALALGRQVLESDGGLTLEMLDGERSEIYAVCTL